LFVLLTFPLTHYRRYLILTGSIAQQKSNPLSLTECPNDRWWKVHIAEIFIRQFSSLSLSDPYIRFSALI